MTHITDEEFEQAIYKLPEITYYYIAHRSDIPVSTIRCRELFKNLVKKKKLKMEEIQRNGRRVIIYTKNAERSNARSILFGEQNGH